MPQIVGGILIAVAVLYGAAILLGFAFRVIDSLLLARKSRGVAPDTERLS